MHFQIGMRRKMREDLAHPGLNPLSFFISSNCQTSVLDFGISLTASASLLFHENIPYSENFNYNRYVVKKRSRINV